MLLNPLFAADRALFASLLPQAPGLAPAWPQHADDSARAHHATGDVAEQRLSHGDNEWQLRETVTLQANRQLYIDSSSYDEKRFYRIKLIE